MNFIQKVRSVYAFITKGVHIDRSYDIPYLAGYSADGTTVYLDKDLPVDLTIDGEPFDVTEPLAVHELTEWVLEHKLGYTYQKAHRLAIKPEELLVHNKKHSPAAYEKALKPYIKHAESKTKVNAPDDLDMIPYKGEKKAKMWFGKEVAASASSLVAKMATILKDEGFLQKWQDAVLEPSDFEIDEDGDEMPTGPSWADLIPEVYHQVGLKDKDHVRVHSLDDPEWKKVARKYLDIEFKEFSSEFSAHAKMEGGKIVCWRCIGTGLKPLIEKIRKGSAPSVGIYWAWNEDGASCYWKRNKKTDVMMKGLIPISSIDVERTLIQNLSPFHKKETEIRLIKGAPLEVVEVKKKDADKGVKVKPTKVSAAGCKTRTSDV